MTPDISKILEDWPFEPGRLNVRLVQISDSRQVVQVRSEMGIVQMETQGRPDGRSFDGEESLLDLLESRIEAHQATGEDTGPFQIDPDQAQALREEAALYYQRYVAFMTLEEFDAVVADANRNLRVFDLCRDHAMSSEDQEVLEQFRPQVIATRARAQAAKAIGEGDAKSALVAINEAIEEIRRHAKDLGGAEPPEIQLLVGMRDVLVPRLPSSQRVELEQRLKAAIDAENYELAAVLRDELRMMK